MHTPYCFYVKGSWCYVKQDTVQDWEDIEARQIADNRGYSYSKVNYHPMNISKPEAHNGE